jgi:hypothetical protein
MSEMEFVAWWAILSSKLKAGTIVRHWSAHGQYQPDSFRISKVNTDRIWYTLGAAAPPATKRRQRITLGGDPVGPAYLVPNKDAYFVMKYNFHEALNAWHDYCALIISRQSMDAKVDGSTYVISIIHWLEENGK